MTAETEKNNALVSVIVPAYNVEKYIAKCLDSILSQTYTNLEVILIDDGSTDSTGSICDNYARKDERVKVIHQENQGQAVGRNVGLREAKGEWIQFVDSDDWIEPDTLETCYRYAQEYNVDMVIFRRIKEYFNGEKLIPSGKFAPRLKNNYEAMKMLAFSAVAPWNKFTKAQCYNGVEFPAGKIYEDFVSTCKVFSNTKSLLEIDNVFYHYVMRNDSTTHDIFTSKSYDHIETVQQFQDLIINSYDWDKQTRNNILVGTWIRKTGFVHIMIRQGIKGVDKDYIRKLRKEIKILPVLRCPYINRIRKMQLLLLKFSFNGLILSIYRYFYLKYYKP